LLHWNCNLHHQNATNENATANVQFHIGHGNAIDDPACYLYQYMSAVPNVSRLIRHTRKSMKLAQNMLLTVNAIEPRRNKGVKKK
jgi:hypothetical protein